MARPKKETKLEEILDQVKKPMTAGELMAVERQVREAIFSGVPVTPNKLKSSACLSDVIKAVNELMDLQK